LVREAMIDPIEVCPEGFGFSHAALPRVPRTISSAGVSLIIIEVLKSMLLHEFVSLRNGHVLNHHLRHQFDEGCLR
jgi:hypothetical protein